MRNGARVGGRRHSGIRPGCRKPHDAAGDRAFCAGGDIAQLYETGRAGDFAFGRKFWADEYRLNAKIFNYPKPVISFLQGFTMGGGVGLGCHGSHRVVGDSSQIAMPECGIGLIPDVGGTLMLALAPGRLGEYLGTTGYRMSAADAIYAGFADLFISEEKWPELIAALEAGGSADILQEHASDTDTAQLKALQDQIDATFAGESLVASFGFWGGKRLNVSGFALGALTPSAAARLACSSREAVVLLKSVLTWRAS